MVLYLVLSGIYLVLSGTILYLSQEAVEERWATNTGPPGNVSLLYSYYSTLTSDQLDMLLDYYQDDCLLYQYPCHELIDKIRRFQFLNPNHRHEYKNTWSGRTVS